MLVRATAIGSHCNNSQRLCTLIIVLLTPAKLAPTSGHERTYERSCNPLKRKNYADTDCITKITAHLLSKKMLASTTNTKNRSNRAKSSEVLKHVHVLKVGRSAIAQKNVSLDGQVNQNRSSRTKNWFPVLYTARKARSVPYRTYAACPENDFTHG